jgi:hypothetical protein
MPIKALRRALAALTGAALVWSAPGVGVYAALAQEVAPRVTRPGTSFSTTVAPLTLPGLSVNPLSSGAGFGASLSPTLRTAGQGLNVTRGLQRAPGMGAGIAAGWASAGPLSLDRRVQAAQ